MKNIVLHGSSPGDDILHGYMGEHHWGRTSTFSQLVVHSRVVSRSRTVKKSGLDRRIFSGPDNFSPPDWTINEYAYVFFEFIDWCLIHLVKFLVSAFLIALLYVCFAFKERIAKAAGVEHVTFFRLGKWGLFSQPQLRPIEVGYVVDQTRDHQYST